MHCFQRMVRAYIVEKVLEYHEPDVGLPITITFLCQLTIGRSQSSLKMKGLSLQHYCSQVLEPAVTLTRSIETTAGQYAVSHSG